MIICDLCGKECNDTYSTVEHLFDEICRVGKTLNGQIEYDFKDVKHVCDDCSGEVISKCEPKPIEDGCPDCGCKLMFSEGCRTCPHCGWSKCG